MCQLGSYVPGSEDDAALELHRVVVVVLRTHAVVQRSQVTAGVRSIAAFEGKLADPTFEHAGDVVNVPGWNG